MAQTEAAEVQVSLKDQRICQARRAGCRHALMGGGVPPEQQEESALVNDEAVGAEPVADRRRRLRERMARSFSRGRRFGPAR